MSDTDPRQPGPRPLNATADHAELARALPRPASPSKYRLAASVPPAPPIRGLGRPLAGAGYTMHHRTRHLLCRPGGTRLLPAAESVAGPSRMALSRTARDLPPGLDRPSTCSGTRQIVSAGPAGVLPAVGFPAILLGRCTQLVTGSCEQEPGTGQ
jgi:hypothetical protein